MRPKICVYAFSTSAFVFERLLKEMPDVEWSVIFPRGHQMPDVDFSSVEDRAFYLYKDYNERYESLGGEKLKVGLPSDVDGLICCLLKDKDGFRHIDGEEQLKRAGLIYQLYKEFLLRVKPQFMLFPDVEVVDGFVLFVLCKELGIVPVYHVGMRFLGGSFFAQDPYETLPLYYGKARGDGCDPQLIRSYVRNVLGSGRVPPFLCEQEKVVAPEFKHPRSLVRRVWSNVVLSLGRERLYAGEDSFFVRVQFVFRRALNKYRGYWFRFIQSRLFHVRVNCERVPGDYVLYALQYTPESSINGVEPYYVDQLRAIDALLFSLPHNTYLLVKEHPTMAGVRSSSFYRLLRKRPGVLLVAPGVDTSRLLRSAKLVASVTGTIGLEAYLLQKPFLLFGRNFFSFLSIGPLARFGRSGELGRLLEAFSPPSEDELVTQLEKFISVRYPFTLADPFADPSVMSPANIKAFAEALRDHLRRLGDEAGQ